MSFDIHGEYNGNFDYQELSSAPNVSDLLGNVAATLDIGKSDWGGQLYGIVSETDGGIIAYAIGRHHMMAMVAALNESEGRYEAEMVSAKANGEDD